MRRSTARILTTHTAGVDIVGDGADDRREEVGQFGGRYLDRLERRDGAWRISERVVVHDWSLCEVVAPEWGGLEAFARGGAGSGRSELRILGGVAGRTT